MSRHRNVKSRTYSYDEDYGYDDYDDYYEEDEGHYHRTTQLSAFMENATPTQDSNVDAETISSLVEYIRTELAHDHFIPDTSRIEQMLALHQYDPDATLQYFRTQSTTTTTTITPTITNNIPITTKGATKSRKQKAKQKANDTSSKQQNTTTATNTSTVSHKKVPSASPKHKPETPVKPNEKIAAQEESSVIEDEQVSDDDWSQFESPQEPLEWEANGKPSVTAVVVGHVDAGKSTLMGQLLLQLGCVTEHQVRKYHKAAQSMGKGSFYLAWVMDEHEEERAHGVTIDVASRSFETTNRQVHLLDAPGHRDFIPNLIDGVSSADVAVLVVPAAPNEYETAMGESAQTREHAVLLRSLGIKQIIVAVNKIDSTNPPYDQERYSCVTSEVQSYLESIGYKSRQIRCIPVSAYNGDNVVTLDATSPLASWYHGPTLVDAFDTFKVPPKEITKELRAMITEVLNINTRTVEVMVRVIQGVLRCGHNAKVYPLKQLAHVSAIELDGTSVSMAPARTEAKVVLGFPLRTTGNSAVLQPGFVLAKGPKMPRVSSSFRANITCVATTPRPLLPGYYDLHIHGARMECAITKITSIINPQTQAVIQKSPQFIAPNATARVKISMRDPLTIEDYADCAALGRFVLRENGQTVAVGMVQKSTNTTQTTTGEAK